MNVAVIGASNDPSRYSYQAIDQLRAKGHAVFAVHPKLSLIDDLPVYASVNKIPQPVDTVTLYVGAEISTKLSADILALKPRRIIFNPGAENPDLAQRARDQGISVLEACTLVMLRTGQF